MSDAVISVHEIGKRYRVGERERYLALRDVIARTIAAPFRKRQTREESILWALRDVSFDIRQGEVVGLIGRNGAGKSTLLKVLARITKPSVGWAEVRGRVGSLLEVGTGFHPELTGRENVFLSGAVLGMKKVEIRKKFDEIVAFAEVERFLDTPLKHYSSGMQMRLAFAVAAHLEPEILLVDEVLAVGDTEFQKKCLGKMSEVSDGGRTILFVSHQMSQIRRLCERVIWIDHGSVKMNSDALGVISAYETIVARQALEAPAKNGSASRDVTFMGWELLVEDGQSKYVLDHFGPVSFRILIHLPRPILKGMYNILLTDDQDRIMWHASLEFSSMGPGTFECLHHLPILPLKPGTYRWKAGFHDGHRWADPWWAVPELVIGTKPITNTADEYQGLLNLACETEVREVNETLKPAP
jgi:lipopolysaccharide transport system ATP-binding protein